MNTKTRDYSLEGKKSRVAEVLAGLVENRVMGINFMVRSSFGVSL